MAHIPDELIAESQRAEESKGGLKQMFSREGAHAPPARPAEPEGDALLDMLFDDARDDGKSAAAPPVDDGGKAPKPPVAPKIPKPTASVPPPRAAHAIPPLPATDDAELASDTIDVSAGSDELFSTAPGGEDETPAEPPHGRAAQSSDAETTDVNPAALDAAAATAEPAPLPAVAEIPPVADRDGSVAPPRAAALPSRMPPPVAFEREEDASALLLRQQQRDAWVARAEWLRAEAESHQDTGARARGLLLVSELYAMAGEEGTARTVAEEVQRLAPSSPLAHRQVRGLVTRDGDWAAVLDVLDTETRAAATPEARCHGALFGAEIARLCLSDDEGAKKRVDQALRVLPGDPRAHVQRFCEALATPDPDDGTPPAVTKVQIPNLPELAPLPEAAQQVLAHRGLTPATTLGKHPPQVRPQVGGGAPSARPSGSTYEALLRVRAAASAADHTGVVAGLSALGRAPSLTGGAEWLAGVLGAVRKETRARSVEAFRAVATGTHGGWRCAPWRPAPSSSAIPPRPARPPSPLATLEEAPTRSAPPIASRWRRSPYPRARERRPPGATRSSPGSTRSSAIRSWPPSPRRRAPRSAATASPRCTPSAAPARAPRPPSAAPSGPRATPPASAAPSPATPTARPTPAWPAPSPWSWTSPTAPAAGSRAPSPAGARTPSSSASARWPAPSSPRPRARSSARATSSRTCAASTPPARPRRARRSPTPTPTRPPRSWPSTRRRSRAAAAPRCSSSRRRSASPRRGTPSRATPSSAAPPRPIPSCRWPTHLGERAARQRGDREALIEWIRARRDGSPDPAEQAHDLVREALLLADSDAAAAAPLLEAALRARPTDVALREIYERLAPEPPADRASWRAERAAEATGVEAARLWLDAALELERTGDLEGAARAAQQAIAAGESLLAPIAAYRAALQGHGTGDIVDQLLPQARASADAVERLEIYERLAELDERGRGDAASGLLFRRTILEETPGHLPTLRRVASNLIGAGRDEELEPIVLDIARALEGPESVAHAMLASRLHQRTGTWDETREAVEIAYQYQPRGIWALRQMAAHARAKGEATLALEAERALIERTNRPSEAATLSLRAAQDALKAGQIEDALAFLAHAINLVPHHIVAHLDLAAVLEQTKNPAGAAASLEAAAAACAAPTERARLLYRAAILWYDEVDDPPHARDALEAVAAIDPSYEDVFQRLQAIYIAGGARAELAALLERRLEAVTDPTERVEMEVLRGRALADVGDAAAAKHALAAALDANPDHVDALNAYGDVCASEEDWSGAEQAWIRLARLVPEPERQAAIYFRLGDLYDERLPNPERAELAYQEILKHSPGDTKARERLVGLYLKMDDPARAIEQQTLLVNAAEAPEAKCERTTQLASIYETVGDPKKAEATLLQARKTWPKDDVALAALARFYLRNNQVPAANVLLDRAVADARRALGTGRFEPYLFSTIATVAELRHRPDAARVAKAAVASLDGGDAALEGATTAAADTMLDDLLAPEVITLAFRDLLKKTGPLLDTAVPYDLASVRGAPLAPPAQRSGRAHPRPRRQLRPAGHPGVHLDGARRGLHPGEHAPPGAGPRPPARHLVPRRREELPHPPRAQGAPGQRRGHLAHRADRISGRWSPPTSRPSTPRGCRRASIRASSPTSTAASPGPCPRGSTPRLRSSPPRSSARSATAPRRSTPSSTAGATAPACSPRATSTSPSPASPGPAATPTRPPPPARSA